MLLLCSGLLSGFKRYFGESGQTDKMTGQRKDFKKPAMVKKAVVEKSDTPKPTASFGTEDDAAVSVAPLSKEKQLAILAGLSSTNTSSASSTTTTSNTTSTDAPESSSTQDASKPAKQGRKRPPPAVDSNWSRLSKKLKQSTPAKPYYKHYTREEKEKHKNASAESTLPTAPSTTTPTTNATAVVSPEVVAPAVEMTHHVALDCEMVGIGPGGQTSALARVSIVNYNLEVLLDVLVRPKMPITDYRTAITGLRASDFASKPTNESDGAVKKSVLTLEEAQAKVSELIRGRVVVGHALHHDLSALMLDHPHRLRRDTSTYAVFRRKSNGRKGTRKLVDLALERLGLQIQDGTHSSVEDARATMLLYKSVQKEWESHVAGRKHSHSGSEKKPQNAHPHAQATTSRAVTSE